MDADIKRRFDALPQCAHTEPVDDRYTCPNCGQTTFVDDDGDVIVHADDDPSRDALSRLAAGVDRFLDDIAILDPPRGRRARRLAPPDDWTSAERSRR